VVTTSVGTTSWVAAGAASVVVGAVTSVGAITGGAAVGGVAGWQPTASSTKAQIAVSVRKRDTDLEIMCNIDAPPYKIYRYGIGLNIEKTDHPGRSPLSTEYSYILYEKIKN
jgi:hypothetical protein